MNRTFRLGVVCSLAPWVICLSFSSFAGTAADLRERATVCSVLPVQLIESADLVARFATLDQAVEVAARLDDAVFSPTVSKLDSGGGWSLLATYLRIPAESDHVLHVRRMRTLVRRHGGEYLGSGCSSIAFPR